MGWIGYAILAWGLVAWVFPVPMTLLHELGHALPALAFGREHVVVSVGWQPTRTGRVGRLDLRVRLLNHPRWGWFGNVEAEGKAWSRREALIVFAGGPLVTALLLGVLVSAATLVPWPQSLLVWVAVAAAAWELLVTAVPVRYPRWFGPYAGRVSDGYRIVRLFRSS